MLLSTILTFTTPRTATLPAALGRAVYAEVLRQIDQRDAQMARSLHAWDGPVPVTCSGLLGARRARADIQVGPGTSYEIHITGLMESVSQVLHAFLVVEPETTWTIHGHPFNLQSVTCNAAQHPWAGLTDYETLAAANLLDTGNPSNRVTLDFASPTAFKSAGMTVPVPLPNLVFGSLVERWNTFSPVMLSPEMRRFGAETVAISSYQLRSEAVMQKGGGMRVGGVGRATYIALDGDRYWHGAMQMLADFAKFSGVGVQTTNGMGQVRRVG